MQIQVAQVNEHLYDIKERHTDNDLLGQLEAGLMEL